MRSSVGSKRLRAPSIGDEPEAKRVQEESPSRRCSRRQARRLAPATLPKMSVGLVTTAPSSGDVMPTEGRGPVGAAAATATSTSSLPASAPSLAVNRST